MAGQIRRIFYFASTHWDREWYRPFQEFRMMLVERIDEIIQVLEDDPAFSVFTFDGQTILLDDYCEIRPEMREKLIELIQNGRIIIGPWYTMPDELLVSGESLVRNLLIGHQLSQKYGGQAMKYGYLCDVFGHAAQMPQILAGFGIHGALVGRGTNQADFPANFIWQSPDGTRCLTFKVPESTGYASFWADVYLGHAGHPDQMLEAAKQYVERETTRTDVPFVVLMDGMDHERIHRQAPWLAGQLSEIFACPVVFDSLEKYADDVSTYAASLPVRQGELIETAEAATNHHMLIPHTLSSRYDIKLANDQCQNLYEKWVLPLAACRLADARKEAQGRPVSHAFWQAGYRYITQNHAHDSICGCSIDQVHQDMHNRYRQARSIGSRLVDDALLCMFVDSTDKTDGHHRLLTVYNPLPFPRKETILVNLDFPADYPCHFTEYKRFAARNAFRLIDADGRELPYNLLKIRKNSFVREVQERYRTAADMHLVAFVAELPAMGAAEYQVVPSTGPVRYLQGLATSDHNCENQLLVVSIRDNGSVDILDKRNGKQYTELIRYRDCGETGDGWHHVPPIEDAVFASSGSPCTVTLLNDGPALCVFSITQTLMLPIGLDVREGHAMRSSLMKPLVVTSRISLGAESGYVDVETTVDNAVRDHRLQLVLPTGVAEQEYEADQAFCFVHRQTGFDRSTGTWYEHAVPEKPFESIVLKRDRARHGLAFISAGGLHECSVLDDACGTILITLLRCFAKTHLTDGEPDGQLQGESVFKYRLMPLDPADHHDVILKVKDSLQAGQKSITRRIPSSRHALHQPGWLEARGRDIAVTMIKPAEEGEAVVVRLVNYGQATQEAQIITRSAIAAVHEADLLEESVGELAFSGRTVKMLIKPAAIKTYMISFDSYPDK